MISFQGFGYRAGLGNQLFQYAFLRSTARRLGVGFRCPDWIGDSLFLLMDEDERERELSGINKSYREPKKYVGFNESALKIEDGTDIAGFFQTERYFCDKYEVREWFTFRAEKVARVEKKYDFIDFSRSVSLHLRFKDYLKQSIFVVPGYSYYSAALSVIRNKETVLVFSDDQERAKHTLRGLEGNIVFVEGNEDYEDLHLMSLCHDNICAASSFSWWGAWLNRHEDKTVFIPKWWFRPGSNVRNRDICAEGWKELQAEGYLYSWLWGKIRYVSRKIEKRL